ncbi:MAG: hypothetical protein KA803_08195 [Rhodoferax sp.]|nr:hypothetical protein [Rhodoferax sp.]
MPKKSDLSAHPVPESAPAHARLEVVAGVVVAKMGKPTAAQKRFNKLMASIEAARAESKEVQRVTDAHRPTHVTTMQQLARQVLQLRKDMIQFLDRRLQVKGLTANQKQQSTHILLSLCDQLAHLDDPELDEILSRHRSAEDMAELEQDEAAAAEEAKAFMEDFLGEGFASDQDFSNPEDVLNAAMDRLRAKEEEREAKRQARKAKKAPTARQQAAADLQIDAQNALRTIYRQLASTLHPDREADLDERARKTALMSEVNAAYGRKDLTALLRIQLQCEMVDASKIGALSDDKLKAMCLLLNEQLSAMQADLMSQRMVLAHDFGFSPHMRFREDDFIEALQEQKWTLEEEADFMHADLAQVQDDKAFKAWLKLQTRISKAHAREAEESLGMDDLIFEMMRRQR